MQGSHIQATSVNAPTNLCLLTGRAVGQCTTAVVLELLTLSKQLSQSQSELCKQSTGPERRCGAQQFPTSFVGSLALPKTYQHTTVGHNLWMQITSFPASSSLKGPRKTASLSPAYELSMVSQAGTRMAAFTWQK